MLAAQLEPCDRARAVERLDDLGRALFGTAALGLRDQVARVGTVLESHGGLWVSTGDAVEQLLLPRVLAGGGGHPLLLSAIAAEAGRRAGLCTAVVSSSTGWYEGLWVPGASALALLRLSPGAEPPPQAGGVRAHCGHEVAYAVLDGLERRLAAHGAPRALRARRLRAMLPVSHSVPDLIDCAERQGRAS